MWLSRNLRPPAPMQEDVAETQVQTTRELTGADNERLQLAAPGGFAWQPTVGEQLLVFKDLALGSKTECPVELAPGECCLFTQDAYLHLTADGGIALHGRVTLNGTLLGETGD